MQPRSQLRAHPVSLLGLFSLDRAPPSLRPLVRAYVLGYASSVAPRLLTLLLQLATRARRQRDPAASQKQEADALASLRRIILIGFDWRRFPTFCAVLVGGSTLFQVRRTRLLNASPMFSLVATPSPRLSGRTSPSCTVACEVQLSHRPDFSLRGTHKRQPVLVPRASPPKTPSNRTILDLALSIRPIRHICLIPLGTTRC